MWKDFAPRLRKSIVLALESAQQRAHARVTSSHLLEVIARDPIGAAWLMLRDCGVDTKRLLQKAEDSFCEKLEIPAACGLADQESQRSRSAKPQAAGNSQVTLSAETMTLLDRAGEIART